MSTGLAASTVTPGKTAPDVSFTIPVNVLWACAAAGSNRNRPAAIDAALRVRANSLAIPQSFQLRRCCCDSYDLGKNHPLPTHAMTTADRERVISAHEYRPAEPDRFHKSA